MISAWTSTTSTVATNIATTTNPYVFGGSYITTTPLSSAAFTAHWTAGNLCGMLAVALQPPGTANSGFMAFM